MLRNAITVSAIALLALLAGAGCTSAASDACTIGGGPAGGTALAKVGNAVITKEDFEHRIDQLNPYIRTRYRNLEQKKKLLDTMVRNEVLSQEAVKRGLLKDPQVVERMKNEMAQRLIAVGFDEPMKDTLVTEEDIQKYYQEHLSDYQRDETVRISHIFFGPPNQAKAQKIHKQAQEQKEDRRSFSKLAQENSEDAETAKLGGDLNYYTKVELTQKFGAAFAEAAFALTTSGDLAPLVKTDKGFHVIKLRGRRPAINRPFDQVKASIKSRLFYNKRTDALEKWIGDMRDKMGVSVNDSVLEQVAIKESESGPADKMQMPQKIGVTTGATPAPQATEK